MTAFALIAIAMPILLSEDSVGRLLMSCTKHWNWSPVLVVCVKLYSDGPSATP